MPLIVSEEVWRKAEVLRHRNTTGGFKANQRQYLLGGLIRCGHCNLGYVGSSPGHRSKPYSYYRCVGSANINRTLEEPCRSAHVRADKLEALVWQDIEGFIRDPGPVIADLEAKLKSETAERRPVEEELAEVERHTAQKKADRERVINLYRRRLIDDAEVEKELTALEREIGTLNDRREKLLAESYTLQDLQTQTTNARLMLEGFRDRLTDACWEDKRQLVQALVESITTETVVEDGKRVPKTRIRYRFSGGDPDDPRGGGGEDISHASLGLFRPMYPTASPCSMRKLASAMAPTRR